MVLWIILFAIATSSNGQRLPETDGLEERAEAGGDGRTLTKRHANIQAPAWGFLPIFAAPPVIQVHHVIHLQSPDRRCFPNPFPGQLPSAPPTQSPLPANNVPGGLDNRFGNTNETTPAVSQPSPCVWAIVSCCSPGNTNIRYACFELLGCEGAFWDLSPCEPRVVQAAANTALMFYMSAKPVNNQSNVVDFDVPESSSIESPAPTS